MRVILCPHYDDGLLSLPNLLLACAAELRAVIVFSEEDPALAEVCDAQHRHLGIACECLGQLEAYRRGMKMRDILRTIRDPDTFRRDPLVRQIADGLDNLVPAQSELLTPLGLVHVDHVLVRLAAEDLCSRTGRPTPLLYADEPYATMWPAAAARARIGLESIEECVPTPDPEKVAGLLDPLTTFVGRRDIARLLRAQSGHSGDRVSLWRSPPRGP